MAALSVTAKGQVTLKRDLLRHMGVEPGERVELEKMPGGELRIRAIRPVQSIETFFHALDGKVRSDKPLTIDEMNDIAAAGWAGRVAGE